MATDTDLLGQLFAGLRRVYSGGWLPARSVLDAGDGLTATDDAVNRRTVLAVDTVELAAMLDGIEPARTGTVSLSAAQAWADVGAVVAISASTTDHYELAIRTAYPTHTTGAVETLATYDEDAQLAVVEVAITRSAGSVITVAQRNGGASYDMGRVLVRATDGGSGTWKLQVERDTPAANEAVNATVTISARLLTTQAWSGDDSTTWVDPDGGTTVISAATPQPIGEEAVGATGDAADAGHVHQIDGLTTAVGADGAAFIATAVNVDRTTKKPFDIVGTVLQLIGSTSTFIRGVTTGGWLFTPGEDGAVSTAAAVNADGTTAKPIALTATTATVNAGTQVQAEQGGTARVTDTVAAAYTRIFSASLSSLSDTIAQHGSAAGITRTLRGQQGFAGQVGGDFVTGAGDGGTTGTNAPGVYRIKTGTPVANVGGRYSLEHEDGTKYFEVKQSASGVTQISGGPIGAETHNLLFRTTNVQFETTSGFITLVSAADVYLDHGTGYFYHRENGVTVATQKNDADGASYINWITGVTSVELRHNTSPRVAFDSTTVTLSADEVVRKSAAGTVYQRERVATATISSATTTTVDSFTTTSNRVYDVSVVAVVTEDSNNVGATYHRYAAFWNEAGTLAQIGTTDNGGTTDKEDATIAGYSLVVDFSGTAIRVRLTTDAGEPTNVNTVTTITERVQA